MEKYTELEYKMVFAFLNEQNLRHGHPQWKLKIYTFENPELEYIKNYIQFPSFVLINATCCCPGKTEHQRVIEFTMYEDDCRLQYHCFENRSHEIGQIFNVVKDSHYPQFGIKTGHWKELLSEFLIKTEIIRANKLRYPKK